MPRCEICGAEKPLIACRIESTVMHVCQKCSAYGEVLKLPSQKTAVQKPQPTGPVYTVVPGYATIIRTAREKAGLTQEEFAKRISEKESVVHKLETGHQEPSIDLARKLEKLLHITLVEEQVELPVEQKKAKTGGLTIGDLIQLK